VEQATLASRKQWAGRLAAVFYLASGALSLVSLPLSSPDADTRALAAVSISALAIGAVAWFVDWGRYDRRASLALVPPGLALIAAGNAFGGSDYYTYGVFFLLVFVWLGFAHAPGTSLAVAPLAAAAYVVPLLFLPSEDLPEGLGSAAVVLPLCVLIGEALSRGSERTLRTEAALQRERENRERERQVDAMKTTFLRAASHELRTPITVSRGHLDVLDANAEPREIAETVHLVVDELARMGRLVDDITTLTRLEDPSALRIETFAAGDLLREVVAKAEPLLDGRLSLDHGSDDRVRGDRQRLTQALLGLLSNAASHAGPDARVVLRSRLRQEGWRFEVSDDGVGLGSVDRTSLFQPFVHGPRSTGSGLGLALVQAIARAHGGEAGVADPPARSRGRPGITFWIRIRR
jgi:signal transduction histidine kinase